MDQKGKFLLGFALGAASTALVVAAYKTFQAVQMAKALNEYDGCDCCCDEDECECDCDCCCEDEECDCCEEEHCGCGCGCEESTEYLNVEAKEDCDCCDSEEAEETEAE